MGKAPGAVGEPDAPLHPTGLDGLADRAQDRADLAAEEDQGDDRDDGDEGEDQRVLGEALAFLIAADAGEEPCERVS